MSHGPPDLPIHLVPPLGGLLSTRGGHGKELQPCFTIREDLTDRMSDVRVACTPSTGMPLDSPRSCGAAPPPSRRLSPSSADSVHPRRRCWWCTWSTTCATSSMELIITIKEVLAVQLGNAASKQQMPPAYHHRDALTSCSLSAGCTLQVAGGRRATLMDVLLMPVARQNSAAACWRSVVCSVHRCVRSGGGGRMGAGEAA